MDNKVGEIMSEKEPNTCVLGNGYCVIEFRDCFECVAQNEELQYTEIDGDNDE